MAYQIGKPLEYDPWDDDQDDPIDSPSDYQVGESVDDPFAGEDYDNNPQSSNLDEPDEGGHSLWDIPRMMGKGAAQVGRVAALIHTIVNPFESTARVAGLIGDLTNNDALKAHRDFFVKHGLSARIERWGKVAEEYYDEQLTPAMKKSMNKNLLASAEEEGLIGPGLTDPWKIAGLIAESIPSTVISMGGGALIAKNLIQTGLKSAPKIIQGAIARQVEKHGIEAVAGVIGGAAGEGGYSGLANAHGAYEEMMDTPQEKLAKSSTYQEIYNSLPNKMNSDEKHLFSRKTLALAAAGFIGSTTAVTTGILGAPSGAFMGKLIGGKAGKSFWGNLLYGAFSEGFIEEAPQSGVEQFVTNFTKRFLVDPNQPLTEGMGEAMAGGAVAGFFMGGGMAVVAGKEGEKPSDARKILTGEGEAVTKARDILLGETEADRIRKQTQGKAYQGDESIEAEEEAAEVSPEDLKQIPTPAIQKEVPSVSKGKEPVPSKKPQGEKPVTPAKLPKSEAAPTPGGVLQKPKQDEAAKIGTLKHFTTPERAKGIKAKGFDPKAEKPLFGTGGLDEGPKEGKFAGDALYLSLDDKAWSKLHEFKPSGAPAVPATGKEGKKAETFYDYEKQNWMARPGEYETTDLAGVDFNIDPKARILKIDSVESSAKAQGKYGSWESPEFWNNIRKDYDAVSITNTEQIGRSDPDNKFFKSAMADQLIVLNKAVAKPAAPEEEIIDLVTPAPPRAPMPTEKPRPRVSPKKKVAAAPDLSAEDITDLVDEVAAEEGLDDEIIDLVTPAPPRSPMPATPEKEIAKARKEVDTDPTDGQKDAGNYKKGHPKVLGFDIVLENPKGETRSGKDAQGKPWSQTMANDYGYFARSEGKDGDEVDVFLGDDFESDQAFIVSQVDPVTKKPDEDKVMLGFKNKISARAAYFANYEKGWQGFGSIRAIPLSELQAFIDGQVETKKSRKAPTKAQTIKDDLGWIWDKDLTRAGRQEVAEGLGWNTPTAKRISKTLWQHLTPAAKNVLVANRLSWWKKVAAPTEEEHYPERNDNKHYRTGSQVAKDLPIGIRFESEKRLQDAMVHGSYKELGRFTLAEITDPAAWTEIDKKLGIYGPNDLRIVRIDGKNVYVLQGLKRPHGAGTAEKPDLIEGKQLAKRIKGGSENLDGLSKYSRPVLAKAAQALGVAATGQKTTIIRRIRGEFTIDRPAPSPEPEIPAAPELIIDELGTIREVMGQKDMRLEAQYVNQKAEVGIQVQLWRPTANNQKTVVRMADIDSGQVIETKGLPGWVDGIFYYLNLRNSTVKAEPPTRADNARTEATGILAGKIGQAEEKGFKFYFPEDAPREMTNDDRMELAGAVSGGYADRLILEKDVVPLLEKEEEKPAKPTAPGEVTEFSSGGSRISDIEAHIEQGLDIGVVIKEVSKAGLDLLADYANTGRKVYVDSGAFAARRPGSKPVNWDKVFSKYNQLMGMVEYVEDAKNIYLTAPDVLGNQKETFKLIKKWKGPLQSLIKRGANILVPIQKGDLPPSEFYRQIQSILGDSIIPAVPSNKKAFSTEDLEDLLTEAKSFPAIHFLGISARNKKFPGFKKLVNELAPGLPMSVDASTAMKGTPSKDKYATDQADQGDEGGYGTEPDLSTEYGFIEEIDDQYLRRAFELGGQEIDQKVIDFINDGGLQEAITKSISSGEGLDFFEETANGIYRYALRLQAAKGAKRKEIVSGQLEKDKQKSNYELTVMRLGDVGTKIRFKKGFNKEVYTITNIEPNMGKVSFDGGEVYRFSSDFEAVTDEDIRISEMPLIKAEKGEATKIITPGNRRGYLSNYALVESDDLISSHDPRTFQKNPDYPEGIQERTYHSDPQEQQKVIMHAQHLAPSILLSDDPTPTNGPPMITTAGIVLGGNSRAMSLSRAYRGKSVGQNYKQALAGSASKFGLAKAQVEGMNKPVLVRLVHIETFDTKTLHRIASDFNKTLTQGMSQEAETASMGKNISTETIEKIGLRMANRDLTLRELLGKKDGTEILTWLIEDDVIPSTDRARFVSAKLGLLNDTGKSLIEKAIFGSIIDDPDLISTAPKNLQNKIGRALPSLARLKARGEQWDITPEVKDGLQLATQAQGASLSIREFLKQGSLFADDKQYSQIAQVLGTLLATDKMTRFADRFKGFAADAMADAKDQTFLFAPKSFSQAFKDAFETEVEDRAAPAAVVELMSPDEYVSHLQRRARPPFLEDSGLDYPETVEIEETGETIERMIDAPGYLNDIDDQIQSFDELTKCMAG